MPAHRKEQNEHHDGCRAEAGAAKQFEQPGGRKERDGGGKTKTRATADADHLRACHGISGQPLQKRARHRQ